MAEKMRKVTEDDDPNVYPHAENRKVGRFSRSVLPYLEYFPGDEQRLSGPGGMGGEDGREEQNTYSDKRLETIPYVIANKPQMNLESPNFTPKAPMVYRGMNPGAVVGIPTNVPKMQVFDDGGVIPPPPDTSNLQLQGMDPSVTEPVDTSVDPSQIKGEGLMGTVNKYTKGIDRSSGVDESQVADPQQTPVVGLDNPRWQPPSYSATPQTVGSSAMYDDGGVVGMTPLLKNQTLQKMSENPGLYPESVKSGKIDPQEQESYNQIQARKITGNQPKMYSEAPQSSGKKEEKEEQNVFNIPKDLKNMKSIMENPAGGKIYDDGGVVGKAKDVAENYVIPVARQLGREIVHPDTLYSYTPDQREKEGLPRVDPIEAKIPTPTVPEKWYKSGSGPHVYDDGGPIKNDPYDGHHQMAVLEEGERVLTPEQNKSYETEHHIPHMKMYDDGGPVQELGFHPISEDDVKSQEAMMGAKVLQQPQHMAPVQVKSSEEGAPGAVKPVGVERIAEPAPGGYKPGDISTPKNYLPVEPREISTGGTQPKMTPPEGAVKDQGKPAGDVTSGKPQEPNLLNTSSSPYPLPHERAQLEADRTALKQKMADAAAGAFNNGKFDHVAYNEAKMALADLNRMHPWGTPENHPGVMGKIGHALAGVGEVAGDVIVGPGLTEAIPGTRENIAKQSREAAAGLQAAEAQRVAEADIKLKEAQAQFAGAPKTLQEGVARGQYMAQHGKTPEERQAGVEMAAQYEKRIRETLQDKLNVAAQGDLKKQLAMLEDQYRKSIDPIERKNLQGQMEEVMALQQQQQKQSDHEKYLVAYMKSHGLNPMDPTDRDKASQALVERDTKAKQDLLLPYKERFAKYQQGLQIEADDIKNVQNNATARAMKADEYKYEDEKKKNNEIALFEQVKHSLDMADTNQVAANVVPLLTTLGVISEIGGVKRLNRQELERFLPATGSAFRWIEANWDRLAVGELPDDYQQNVRDFVDAAEKVKLKEHQDNVDVVNRIFGGTAQEPTVTPPAKPGALPTVKPQPYTKRETPKPQNQPAQGESPMQRYLKSKQTPNK